MAGETTPADEDHVKVQYVWDIRYIDAPVLRWRDENDNGDFLDANETLYYCQDANFNVTALVNASGTVVERYVYDPYGKVTIYDDDWSDTRTSSSYANEVLYAGYRFDTETGLYPIRHRAYHPTLGRWMQRDPLGYADGMGLYEYVCSSPCGERDPSGESLMLDSRYPCAPWFAQFAQMGCCDCERQDVEAVLWNLANASAAMMDRAHSEVISAPEAAEWTSDGVVADAIGTRTDIYAGYPLCAKKIVDDMENSWAMTLSTIAGYIYHAGATYRSTGHLSLGNAWLAMEAKRSEVMARGIRKRLKECEGLKQQHAIWPECCRCAGEGPQDGP